MATSPRLSVTGSPATWDLTAAAIPFREVQQVLTPRQGGQLQGQITIADNFDDFDDELEEMFYGKRE